MNLPHLEMKHLDILHEIRSMKMSYMDQSFIKINKLSGAIELDETAVEKFNSITDIILQTSPTENLLEPDNNPKGIIVKLDFGKYGYRKIIIPNSHLIKQTGAHLEKTKNERKVKIEHLEREKITVRSDLTVQTRYNRTIKKIQGFWSKKNNLCPIIFRKISFNNLGFPEKEIVETSKRRGPFFSTKHFQEKNPSRSDVVIRADYSGKKIKADDGISPGLLSKSG